MKKLLFLSIMLLVSATSFAQAQAADKILGIWQAADSDLKLKFEFYKVNNKYYGRLLYASTMYETDSKTPKKDFKNPDKNLRDRSRYGMTNLTGLTYDDGAYIDGKLYNPDEGRTFSVKAKMKSINELEFRAYWGVSALGRTMIFKRLQ